MAEGPFAGNTPFTNAVLLDMFFSVLAISGLTLTAVIAERDQAARKLTEEKLREYKNPAEGSEEMIAVVDRECRFVIANRKFLEYRNMKKEQVIGRLISDVLNKGVFEAVVKEKLDRCFGGGVVRYEMKYTYPGIGERDVFISYFPVEGTGRVDRVACIMQDVTERRRTEEAIRESEKRFRGRLIEAHEQERTWIARELHDDITQRLALTDIERDRLKQRSPRSMEFRDRVDAERYSGDGAPLTLFEAGIPWNRRSSRGPVRRAGKGTGGGNRLSSNRRPDAAATRGFSLSVPSVAGGIEQCAQTQRGATRQDRTYRDSQGSRALIVSDAGQGFDSEDAMKGPGLGLVSMRERVHLVEGELSIHSQPSCGATVRVRVPLRSEQSLAAGAD
jgi:PAS domain S-box-containing protein